ncbi:leucine-rich repeat-containing protein 25 [Mantella aurantiaca]
MHLKRKYEIRRKMQILIMLITFLYTLSDANDFCNSTICEKSINKTCESLKWSDFESCKIVNLSNSNIGTINPTSMYNLLEKLDLSHNKLTQLPRNFLSSATALTEVNLGNNNLKELPEDFLSNSFKLKVLQLQGNLLTKIPLSVFHSSLYKLNVDCTCDVASSIEQHLNNNSTGLSITCATSPLAISIENVEDFVAKNCGSQISLVLYIVLPIVALGLIVGGVAMYLWKKNNNSADFESKTASETSPSHAQPRYMTRSMDVTASTSNQGPKQDYENVFVGHFQTSPHEYLKDHRPGVPSKQSMEEDIYLESDVNEGNQPIYSNTQGVYYNYHGDITENKEEDDVYILPDH